MPRSDRDLCRLLLERPAVLPSTLLVRREALAAVGGMTTQLRRGEDWDLSLRLADRFEIVAVPEVLVRWNRSTTPPEILLDSYRALVERSLQPRIADLDDPSERARLTAWHEMVAGGYLARSGRRAEARRTLWRAWRTYPRSMRPLVQLGRTVVGEPAWEAVRRAARRR